jgi:hypothetical protein
MAIPPANEPRVPLLGKAEKTQLEELILEKLRAYQELNGPGGLLADGVRVVVTGEGVELDRGTVADPLAAVPVRNLFTALCYLGSEAPALPVEALDTLATEAATAAATQINRIGPG